MAHYIPRVAVTLVREGRVTVDSPLMTSPEAVATLLHAHCGLADREHFVAVLLDVNQRAIGIHTVSIGALSEAIVHPREVFKAALLANAAGVIVGHNHPSGDLSVTNDDIATTVRLMEAGALLGVPVLDHLIIGGDGLYLSLREAGAV
jgi:DNA repair protein RadC